MSSPRERTVFNVYENPRSEYDVVMAVQLSSHNLDTIRKIVNGRIHPLAGVLVWIFGGVEEVAEIGDYIISDMAGNHRAYTKEEFESRYSLLTKD